jgi:hypothetical protein
LTTGVGSENKKQLTIKKSQRVTPLLAQRITLTGNSYFWRTAQGRHGAGRIQVIERQNLTVRMSNRRFTRLTSAFSKKIENHCHVLSIHFMHDNFCRVHPSLRVTPAMEAGLTDHIWASEELSLFANY